MHNYYENLPPPNHDMYIELPHSLERSNTQKPQNLNPKNQKLQKKKFDFKCFKADTCKSLNDVEYFLNNFSDFLRYAKLVKLLKRKK